MLVAQLLLPQAGHGIYDNHGVVFNFEKKVLLTEKFENIQFVVPFPQYNTSIHEFVLNIEAELKRLWEFPPGPYCALNFTKINDSGYKTDWFVSEIKLENIRAQADLQFLIDEMQDLLGTSPRAAEHPRVKRGAAVAIGLAAGVLGAGIGFGATAGCVLKGIFGGGCHNLGDANRRLIQATIRKIDDVERNWLEVEQIQEKKFFLVASELRGMKKIQRENMENQDRNWSELNTTMKVIQQNVNALKNCDQTLYNRGQINHARIVMLTALQQVYTNIKTYRTALFSYRINLLNSLSSMSSRLIPMSLVPKHDLHGILLALVEARAFNNDGLTLALNADDEISAYYETQLLQEVYADEVGLIIKVSIPMATKASKLNIYRAIPIPMPEGRTGRAQVWKLNGNYLAITHTGERHAVLTKQQLDDCVGSTTISICNNGFALNSHADSCLYSLMKEDEMTALKDCETESIQLPVKEQAQNLGYGRWLITSATGDFRLQEHSTDDSIMNEQEWEGCQSCIITLTCGKQFKTHNFKITADLETCADGQSTQLNIRLADPLARIFNLLPSLESMPHIPDIRTAQRELLQDIQLEIRKLPTSRQHSLDNLERLAEPTLMRLSQISPQISTKIEESSNWFRLFLFLGNAIVVHLLFFVGGKVYSHYIKRSKFMSQWLHRRPPFRTKHAGRIFKTKPVTVVTAADYDYLKKNPDHPVARYTHPIPDTDNLETTAGPRLTASESHEYATVNTSPPNRIGFPQLRSYLSTLRPPLGSLPQLPPLPTLHTAEQMSNYHQPQMMMQPAQMMPLTQMMPPPHMVIQPPIMPPTATQPPQSSAPPEDPANAAGNE